MGSSEVYKWHVRLLTLLVCLEDEGGRTATLLLEKCLKH